MRNIKTEDLIASLEEARERLPEVGVALAACRAKGTLGKDIYTFFESFATLQVQISDAIGLVELRETCFLAAQQFAQQVSQKTPGRFRLGGAEVSFKQGAI